MANRLILKEGVSANELVKYGFDNRKDGTFDLCLFGYLNWICYDCKTREFVQNVSDYTFQSYTTEKQGRPILKILTNKEEFYVKKGIVIPNGIENIVQLISVEDK